MAEVVSVKHDERAQSDEQRLVKALAIGLPLVTLSVAAVVGVLVGPATAILAIAGGLLLGVIALLWGSIRVLSGDAPLPPELEDLDMSAQGASALGTRKKMLLRALKDLENERAIGKLEDDDYEQISATYRAELKVVLKRIDETLAPHRSKAEEAARAYLVRVGLVQSGYRGEQPREESAEHAHAEKSTRDSDKAEKTKAATGRVTCPTCGESNEPDAKFCKECATKLTAASKELVSAASESDSEDEEDA